MNTSKKSSYLFSIMSFHAVFLFLFYTVFYLSKQFFPLEYEVDTLTYLKITESLRQLSFPIQETFGMSPIYSFFLTLTSFFINSFFNLIFFNIMCSFITINFLYKIFNTYFSENTSAITTLIIISNPFFHNLIFSGFSEMLFYTITSGSIYTLTKKKTKTGIFLSILAINIRPEFLFINLFVIFRKKEQILKKIILSVLFLIIILLCVSTLTTDNSQPFFNKFLLFSTVFKNYSEMKDINKDSFLQEIYFYTDEGYNENSVKKTVERLKSDFSWTTYFKNYPFNYLSNLFRIIKIYFFNFHFMIFLFIIFVPIKKPDLKTCIFLTPFFIVSLFPVESWEFRYFIYTIFIFSFFVTQNIRKRYSYLIITTFYLLSFFFNFNFYSSYTEFFNYSNFFKTNGISNSTICCRNNWIEYFTDNSYFPSPPFSENIFLYKQYIENNKIQYIVLDNNLIHSGEKFFNERTVNFLNTNYTRINNSIPYIFKVEKNNEE